MISPAIVDASVAVKWFVPELRSDEADALGRSGGQLIAPAVIELEVSSALSKKSRAGLFQPDYALKCVKLLPRYFVELVDLGELIAPALTLANELDHPLADCLYLEAARQRDGAMVTDDLRLLAKLRPSRYAQLAIALADWRTVAR